MLRKTLILVLFITSQSIAYELPTNNKSALGNVCNDYANKKSQRIIKENNFKFNFDDELGEKQFYGSLGQACALGAIHAEMGMSKIDSIEQALQGPYYETMNFATRGEMPSDELIEAIKDSVTFGRGLH